MAAKVGRQIAFFWGGNSPGDEIQGVREKGVALNGNAINITSDDDLGWRTLLNVSAEDEVTLSIAGVSKDDRLKRDWFGGARTQNARISYPDGSYLTGTFYLQSFSETGPFNDASTFQASLMSSGVVTYTPAP